MASSGPSKKGSASPGWLRTAKFVAVMATVLILLGVRESLCPSAPPSNSYCLKRTDLRGGCDAQLYTAPVLRATSTAQHPR